VPADAHVRQALTRKYEEEREATVRMELITELSRMDDPRTVTALLKMLAAEKEPSVREQGMAIVGFMAASATQIGNVAAALAENYRGGDTRERRRALEVLSNFPAVETARVVAAIWREANSEVERSVAADAILKLAPRVPMDPAMVRAARELRARVRVSPADLE
jgi:hypothetical protein